MLRIPLIVAFWLPVAAIAQAPAEPKIKLSASGSSGSGGMSTEGTASVSGSIELPPGWQLSIHTITVRFAKTSAPSTTLNVLLPVRGPTFSVTTGLQNGSYKIWAVIDVKDSEGRERQITSDPQTVQLQ